jgi:DNA-binding MarR family transcriptional regulator
MKKTPTRPTVSTANESAAKMLALRGTGDDTIEFGSADTMSVLAFLQLHHSADLIVKAGERDLAGRGLSVAKYAILRMLHGKEPVKLSWIADRHFSQRSNITAMVDRLERDGLVRRLPDPQDRRAMRVALTTQGLAKVEETREPHRSFLTSLMAPLNDDELHKLIKLLAKLSAPLEGDFGKADD